VRGFVEAGARVAIVDRDRSRLDSVEGQVALSRSGGFSIQKDLNGPDSCTAAVDEAAIALGHIDVFVHAIGVNNRKPLLEYVPEEWDDIIAVNLSSAFWFGRAVGRLMVQRGYGRIVFFSSVSGHLAHRFHGPYAASKGGTNQLLRVMATEWAGSGVNVNAVAPGYVETPLTQEYLAQPGIRENLESLVPAGRLGTPDDVVGPVLFLSSQLSTFVTGQVIFVDGGRTLI